MTPDVAFVTPSAKKYSLDPTLVCAVIEQESSWNEWAVRYEPAFYVRYIAPMNLKDATEAQCRAMSFGLMQVMGEVAREAGYLERFLTMLCEPTVGAEVGCHVLAGKIHAASGDIRMGLLRYNGGGNPMYPDQVLARQPRYQQMQTASTSSPAGTP